MRQGGGANKGADFERLICRELSLWISRGARADLFTRNKASGGAFTTAMRRRDAEHGQPGDIAPTEIEALEFTRIFAIECKHYRNLELISYMHDVRAKSLLGQIIALAKRQAKHAKRHFIVIAKENNRPTWAIGDFSFYMSARLAYRPSMLPHWHIIHDGLPGRAVYFIEFDEFKRCIQPDRFMAEARELINKIEEKE